jgi:hypothetical protein
LVSDERVTPGRQLKEKISGYTTRRNVSDFRTEHDATMTSEKATYLGAAKVGILDAY